MHNGAAADEQEGASVRRYKRQFVPRPGPRGGADVWRPEFVEVPLLHPRATRFAVRKDYFGKGAERLVFEMTEVDAAGRPVGKPLVAKDSRQLLGGSDAAAKLAFHERFIETQLKAANLARAFNRRLAQCGAGPDVPRVEFLDCAVYVCEGPGRWPAAYWYLAEARLDPSLYRKWNDNAGGVEGIPRRCAGPAAEAATDAAGAGPALGSDDSGGSSDDCDSDGRQDGDEGNLKAGPGPGQAGRGRQPGSRKRPVAA